MHISDNLVLELREREPDDRDTLVLVDDSSGQEALIPTADIVDFTKRAKEEALRGVTALDVDGITVGGQALANLFVALAYFAGVAPHPADDRQFTSADQE